MRALRMFVRCNMLRRSRQKVVATKHDTSDRQQSSDPDKREEERQEVSLRLKCTFQQNARDVTKVPCGISDVHQEADIASVTCHCQKSFENRGMHGNIRQVKTQTDKHHKLKRGKGTSLQSTYCQQHYESNKARQ